MENALDAIQQALSDKSKPQPQSDNAAQPLPARIIDRVWQRMTEIYGHKWTSNFGVSDTEGTWAAGLADMSLEQLKAGFIACVKRPDPWPPSLPEFRALCTGGQEDATEAEVEELAYNLVPSFDRQTLSRKELEAVARRNLDRARALLKGEAEPRGSEVMTLARLGYEISTDLVRQ